ncbi:hypothetical protein Goarm_000122 [Gossypium armourianum]|uniref:Agenet domain-containing protein n=1 Tax=Gossypium armourianum TaxID=34283 RepID=A0A7J9K8Y6_9ROSI|nr:hypothetical protein [Gossypium armourianum]
MERTTSTNDKRYVVQFTDLYQDKNSGTKLSKEYNSVDILPLPPPQPPRKFKVGDIVEAYFDDGWYEGKIDQVLDDDKYIFRMSSMFLLFGVKQLRLRRTWLNGNWVPPLDESELAVEEEDSTEKKIQQRLTTQKKAKQGLVTYWRSPIRKQKKKKKKKSLVREHVSRVTNINGDGFNQAWFAATIVKPVGNNRYLILTKLENRRGYSFLRERDG